LNFRSVDKLSENNIDGIANDVHSINVVF
jgi:hypothetical protein